MYLGNQRRNRFVALGLAAVLVAGVVLALLATVAAAAPAAGTVIPSEPPAAHGALGSVRGSSSSAAPAGHHDTVDAAPLPSVPAGQPDRLVGAVVAVALLLTCGVMVVHEQRRRGAEPGLNP